MTRISEVLAASSTAILLTAVTPAMANAQSLVDYGSATSSIGVPAAESLSLPLKDEPRPWVAAHRGQWRDHPENSLPAILQAARDGAEVIEIDIKRTKDGHLVLMHDDTVDRTTSGSGRVEDLTLAQIKDLRLRQGLGNGPAPVSDLQVPTFAETLEAVSGQNVLLNLDKGWNYRDQLISELNDAGMLDYGLFKGAPNAAEANEFMASHPDAQYMHIINADQIRDVEGFTAHVPDAIEVAFESPGDAQVQPQYLAEIEKKTDLWLNSMWDSVSGGYTDEASLRDPKLGWESLVDMGADVIQTDDVRIMDAWRDGTDVTRIGMGPSTIRVEAEDYIDDPAFYSDSDEKNECEPGKAIGNPDSPVDACDLDGAHIVQYVRDGEHFTLDVEVEEQGEYNLSLRHSADTEPGGTVTVDAGEGKQEPVSLPNTTHNRAFTVTDLGKLNLSKGSHKIELSFSHPDYLSVDWLQLDQGERTDRELTDMGIVAG